LGTQENQLIERLPKRDRQRVLAACEQVHLNMDDVLWERHQLIRHVYFPTDSFVSMFAEVDKHPGLEVGMVGSEGLLGAQLALGVANAPLHAQVQGAGPAWRMSANAFRAELTHGKALKRCVDRYIYILMAQLASSVACTRFHLLGPRLARWLLMSQDRAHADHFHITHEFLAYMLGVRRVGITVAASAFQRSGLIAYHRGDINVIDRAGLQAMACSCYQNERDVYKTLF
jgi:CRP-like cAMP-binding protein